MIKVEGVTKYFDDYSALDNVCIEINPGVIYGLVGTNGSGKSTLLRLLSGVYKADLGKVTLNDEPIWENAKQKNKIFFVCDDLYFFPSATLDSMADFYRSVYSNWSQERYINLCTLFPLGRKRKIATFSKGMKRQAALILALASAPEYLLLDEAFDGLDPVIRFAVRRLISDIMSEHDMTVVISSHNLRELEDFCNVVGLVHKGRMIFQCNMDNLSLQFSKVQFVLKDMPERLPDIGLRVLSQDVRGSVVTLVCQATEEEILAAVSQLNPIISEIIPLNLEEVFIYEMEAVGYDYKNIIF